jgi:spermidine synthase
MGAVPRRSDCEQPRAERAVFCGVPQRDAILRRVNRSVSRIAALLFSSGMCALVYQVAWLRELRLVFGASTPASAAVLAVFMGGLGLGAWLLGKRVEESARPLELYARLELGIALAAAVTPGLLWLARRIYLATGGSLTLGSLGGTLARLVLSALVLLPPTVLMGGTLPAAARAATDGRDQGRRATAMLYGANTLGAVVGALASSFLLLEIFGTRMTLWVGSLVNVLVALVARMLARDLEPAEAAPLQAAPASEDSGSTTDGMHAESPPGTEVPADAPPSLPPKLVLVAAAASGFVFLLMELVWYRILSPLLGGSSYTFGLILAVALLGIGAGGLAYTLRGAERPATPGAFALTCGLEALAMTLPFALGDRLAWLTLFLRSAGSVGLVGHAVAWSFVTALVVLPAALVSGYQFPLLIALLGRGERGLGRHVGLAYAWNTVGSIVGSLAGGFVLLPALGALGAWKLTIWCLVAMVLATLLAVVRGAAAGATRAESAFGPLFLVSLAVAMLHGSIGPTAFWRHSPIGVGRYDDTVTKATRNSMEAEWRARNAFTSWETDGRESAIALNTASDTAFIVNGKSDGSATIDGGTQVMGGLLGALLHPGQVRRALVIGLGTGSTAGWLAALPDIERVDVIELEPAIVEVAKVCAPVNRDVLSNPKVRLHIADAREILLTTRDRYDLIFSEPSNPYRAGIASLFTREFYRAVVERLEPDGVFVQWLQAYEIDARSVRSVYATLSSAFASIETWRTRVNDLVLVSRAAPLPLDVAQLRERIETEPYREALRAVWKAKAAEDILAHHVAGPSFAKAVASAERESGINTDDRNALEFSVARAIGRPQDFSVERAMLLARTRGEERPELVAGERGQVDWIAVYDALVSLGVATEDDTMAPLFLEMSPDMVHRFRAHGAWAAGDHATTAREWRAQPKEPEGLVELVLVADAFAALGLVEQAEPLLLRLRPFLPIEADVIEARLRFAQKRDTDAMDVLERGLVAYRSSPWPSSSLMKRAVGLAHDLGARSPALAPRALALLSEDYAMRMQRASRLGALLDLSVRTGSASCLDAVRAYGRYFPWSGPELEQRISCLEATRDPALGLARHELDAYLADAGMDFAASLRPERPKARIRFTTEP